MSSQLRISLKRKRGQSSEPSCSRSNVAPIKNTFDGYRIVDLPFVLDWAFDASLHHRKICPGQLKIKSETKEGARSTIHLGCTLCTREIQSHSTTRNKLSLNKGLVWGTINSGNGFAAAEEIMGLAGIQFMCKRTFYTIEKGLSEPIDVVLAETLAENGKAEYELADEVPGTQNRSIMTSYDMMWSKSNKQRDFNGPSGVGAVFGEKTAKVLYVGVKNKVCRICKSNKKRTKNMQTIHVCNKNWKIQHSSHAMESSVAVDAIKCSEELHNLQYTELISDGDASIKKALMLQGKYKITHYKCNIHAMKAFKRALSAMRAKANAANKRIMTPIHRRITSGIYAAIKHNRKTNDIIGLQHDIMNSVDHVLDNHEKCRDYFCLKPKLKNDTIEFNITKEAVCYDQLVKRLEVLNLNAKEQIRKLNSNKPERFFSRINKIVGGKRTSLATRGSFERRCKMAAIQSSRGYLWHADAMMRHGIRVSTITEKFTQTRDIETSKHRVYRSKKPIRKKPRRCKPNQYYGNIQCVLSPAQVEKEVDLKSKALKLLPDAITSIEKATRLSNKATLLEHQKQRLHCDDMPNLLKHQDSKTVFDSLIRKSINDTVRSVILTDKNFKEAKEKLEEHIGTTFTPCGLFIEQSTNYFCCQPHAIAEHIGALFLYCGNVSNDFEKQADGKVSPRKYGYFYHKAQIQMFITGLQKCYVTFIDQGICKVSILTMESTYWQQYEADYTKIFKYRLTETITHDIEYERMLNMNKNRSKIVKAKR